MAFKYFSLLIPHLSADLLNELFQCGGGSVPSFQKTDDFTIHLLSSDRLTLDSRLIPDQICLTK